MSEPKSVRVLARHVLPYRHAIWCSVGKSAPFANMICSVSWSEDGEHLWFMLDSHNFHKAHPDETISVVPVEASVNADLLAKIDVRTAETLSKRPMPPEDCPHCGQRMPKQFREETPKLVTP